MEKSIHEPEFVYLIWWENRELTSVVRGRLTALSQFKLANIFLQMHFSKKIFIVLLRTQSINLAQFQYFGYVFSQCSSPLNFKIFEGPLLSQLGFDDDNSYFLVNALGKKINSYEITVIILKVFKKFKSSIQVTKASFSLF